MARLFAHVLVLMAIVFALVSSMPYPGGGHHEHTHFVIHVPHFVHKHYHTHVKKIHHVVKSDDDDHHEHIEDGW